jgi:hypothetical protein
MRIIIVHPQAPRHLGLTAADRRSGDTDFAIAQAQNGFNPRSYQQRIFVNVLEAVQPTSETQRPKQSIRRPNANDSGPTNPRGTVAGRSTR